jgi:hypothetical protein
MKRRLALFSLLFFAPSIVLAQSTTINATVVSSVDPAISTFVSDLSSLPADGTSLVVLTATILDDHSIPLPNKAVVVTSNRGEVDTIKCYSGNTLTNSSSATSDSNGKARCAASATAAGNATFTAVAEGITLTNKPTVTFTPLPVLTNLTITVTLPGGGTLTILEPPKKPAQTPTTPAEPSTKKLVNTGIEFSIPFWVLLILVLFFLTEPILIILVLRLTNKVRRGFAAEKLALAKEQELLAKVYLLESQVVQTASDIEREVRQIESPAQPQTLPPPLPQSPDVGQSPPIVG